MRQNNLSLQKVIYIQFLHDQVRAKMQNMTRFFCITWKKTQWMLPSSQKSERITCLFILLQSHTYSILAWPGHSYHADNCEALLHHLGEDPLKSPSVWYYCPNMHKSETIICFSYQQYQYVFLHKILRLTNTVSSGEMSWIPCTIQCTALLLKLECSLCLLSHIFSFRSVSDQVFFQNIKSVSSKYQDIEVLSKSEGLYVLWC